jgi:hypothetical protein
VALFDDAVGAGKQRWLNFQAQRFRRFQIDNELKFGWLLDG